MAQTYFANYATYGSNKPTFVGWVEDDKIYYSDVDGQHVLGVVSKSYDQLKADYDGVFARCQEYYDKLVELGVIKPELTGDALIKAQSEKLEQASQLIDQMSKNQEHLMAMLQNLQSQLVASQGALNESSFANNEICTRDFSTVERNDNGINEDLRSIPKHKTRLVTRNN